MKGIKLYLWGQWGDKIDVEGEVMTESEYLKKTGKRAVE